MYSVMWSEHCSYKSSKVHLRYFGETTTAAMKERMLAGHRRERRRRRDRRRLGGDVQGRVAQPPVLRRALPGRGHGRRGHRARHHGDGCAADRGGGPAALRPRGRARTPPGSCPGWSPGVGGYGNCLGLPNVGGEVVFDPTYAGNPLVNALCVGSMRVEDLHLAFASGTGNKIILFGARTGLDGIGGVSVLASETFSDDDSGGRAARSSRACRSATRSPRRCSSSAAWSSSPPGWWSASRTSAARGCRAPPPSWRAPATAACTSSWTASRCAPPA